MKIKEFLQEPSGKYSWLRLASSVTLLVGLIVILLAALKAYYTFPLWINGMPQVIDVNFVYPLGGLGITLCSIALGVKTFNKTKEQEITVEAPASDSVVTFKSTVKADG